MHLVCPHCQFGHVDRGEWATTRVHRTHLCEHCGQEFRPYDFPTVGVSMADYLLDLKDSKEEVAKAKANLIRALAAERKIDPASIQALYLKADGTIWVETGSEPVNPLGEVADSLCHAVFVNQGLSLEDASTALMVSRRVVETVEERLGKLQRPV